MKYLITGGAGFMGSNMVRYLLEQYRDATVVNVDKLTYAGNVDNLISVVKDPRYSFVRADIIDRDTMNALVERHAPDYIVNYAAETHVDRSISRPDEFIRTDVLGTHVLLEAAKRFKTKRYLQVSTDEVYGSTRDGLFSESSPFDPSSPYSASKAGGDHLVTAFHRTYGIDTIVTHSCNVYGPNQYPEKIIPLFITNLFENKKLPVYGDGMQVREWIYVTDHCRAIDAALNHGVAGGTYNIGSGERLTNKELTAQLLVLCGADDHMIEYVQDRPGHDVRYAIDSTKIRETLSWKPLTAFKDGLRMTVDWYRSNEKWWKRIKSGEYLEYYRTQYGPAT